MNKSDIYTVTINPSLDYVVGVENFELGKTNRTAAENIYIGGKGLNTSQVLKTLGIDSTALGFVAGFTGDELIKTVEELGINADFIKLDVGMTRINVKLKSIDGTEINGTGPKIDGKDINRLMDKLSKLKDGDFLVLAGSIPKTVPEDLYKNIIESLSSKDINIVVDATKDLLMNVIPLRPFLIKPNNHELEEIFGVKLETRESVIPYGKRLHELGAKNVLISLAGEGSVLIDESGEVYEQCAHNGKLINGVGAGDSMVAGFIAGWLERQDYKYAFSLAGAAGSATAFSEGLASKELIMRLTEE